jgi:uncharacterized protein (TIGR02996 family)
VSSEEAFLEALHEDPADDTTWLVLADWLEDQNQPERAELARLRVSLRQNLPKTKRDTQMRRQQKLLERGVWLGVPLLHLVPDLTLALIQPGSFLMGSPENETGRWEDEGPLHSVTLTRGFYLGVNPITRAQWQLVMDTSPGRHPLLTHPITSVSWEECREFCRRLSGIVGRHCRLPTEAEWEYACRAGTTGRFYSGGSRKALERIGWWGCGDARPVGQKEPNAWGLYDMLGNVLEWCEDWYDDDYYQISPEVDPPGPSSGDRKVERGGCYGHEIRHCRAAFRRGSAANYQHEGTGFRVVVDLG